MLRSSPHAPSALALVLNIINRYALAELRVSGARVISWGGGTNSVALVIEAVARGVLPCVLSSSNWREDVPRLMAEHYVPMTWDTEAKRYVDD